MTSCDTNILLHAYNIQSPFHQASRNFLHKYAKQRDFVICELVLIEFYVLLRNPAVVSKPLSAEKAVEVCRQYRTNKNWGVIDYPGNIMKDIWKRAAIPNTSRRTIFDARLALTLRYHGVTEFATSNEKHFQNYGFTKIWNPLG